MDVFGPVYLFKREAMVKNGDNAAIGEFSSFFV